jgi:hypothetical protein
LSGDGPGLHERTAPPVDLEAEVSKAARACRPGEVHQPVGVAYYQVIEATEPIQRVILQTVAATAQM